MRIDFIAPDDRISSGNEAADSPPGKRTGGNGNEICIDYRARASGIGKACAQRMAKEGYGVVVADVNMPAAEDW